MESTRPIRSLVRGLDALLALNTAHGSTVAQIAQRIKLPRTTTYRILETLSRSGYVTRDAADDRYRVTLRVRGLSSGFDDEAWITEIARPELRTLSDQVVWPIAMSGPAGATMVIRDCTDDRSPFAIERAIPGTEFPIFTSASGLAFLAFSGTSLRDSVIELVDKSGLDEQTQSVRPQLENMLQKTRDRGFASAIWPRKSSDVIALAVPVVIDGRVIGSMSIRFEQSALSLEAGVERFVPKLLESASRIQAAFPAVSALPA